MSGEYLVALGVALAVVAAPIRAQESVAAITNPFDTPADRLEGARVFRSQCASCHGADGRGGQGTPDLTAGSFRRASSDEGLIQIIAKGIPGTVMPGFSLSARQSWQVLAHLRSMATVRAQQTVSGNAMRGRDVYNTNGCAKCHEAGGAPDLMAAARRLSPAEMRRAILDSQETVSSESWQLRATAKDGRVLQGLRLNEDTFTVQYLDSGGKLRTAVKADFERVEILKKSPMPSYSGKLTETQLSDLVSFLMKRGQQ